MHIYHVASGTPVAAMLRPSRTPKGSEVRTVAALFRCVTRLHAVRP
jgi:hypothetical protein